MTRKQTVWICVTRLRVSHGLGHLPTTAPRCQQTQHRTDLKVSETRVPAAFGLLRVERPGSPVLSKNPVVHRTVAVHVLVLLPHPQPTRTRYTPCSI